MKKNRYVFMILLFVSMFIITSCKILSVEEGNKSCSYSGTVQKVEKVESVFKHTTIQLGESLIGIRDEICYTNKNEFRLQATVIFDIGYEPATEVLILSAFKKDEQYYVSDTLGLSNVQGKIDIKCNKKKSSYIIFLYEQDRGVLYCINDFN